jgi:hypothetical protein
LSAFQVDCEGDADRDEHHHVHHQLDDPESDALFGQALSRGRSAHITKDLVHRNLQLVVNQAISLV